jgi:NADPH-dependent glutamate synthase beta subunit-like oxidoreductase
MTADARHSDTRPEDASRVWAPCRAGCPVHIDVPAYLSAIAEGRFTDALEIVLERNPLPAVCGRICLRPCEDGCRRCQVDHPVAIAHLKRAASDHGLYPAHHPVRQRPERIAIVGSGPAGLTAAGDLAREGYQVTVYEAMPLLGGMLRYGIPEYRLPDKALDRDIEHILSRGVEAHTGVKVGHDVSIDELRTEHDAVLVTVGLPASRTLPIPGADLPQVIAALPFLETSSRKEPVELGDRVVVVGGGNVAMDVARTALRHGAEKVTCVCLEGRDEMPASDHEIREAENEGVNIRCSWGPVAVTGDGEVTGLETTYCECVFDEGGRFAPVFDESVREHFPADSVILAIGQGPDTEGLGLPTTPRGGLEVHPLTLRTPAEGVYAAGDAVSGPTKVIDAIAAGHRAAAAIMADITEDMLPLADLDAENAVLGTVPEVVAAKLETRRRVEMEQLEYFERSGFEEVERGYTEYEAAREAQRCLSCTTGARLTQDKCAACLTCARLCPHGAPVIQLGGYPYFSAEACHACGACASECPAGAIALEGCSEREMSLRVQRELARPQYDQVLAFVCGYTPEFLESLDEGARIVTVPCLLRVSERAVLESLEIGANRVVFSPCVESMCRFPHAIELVAKRTARIETLVRQAGMEGHFAVDRLPGKDEIADVEPAPAGTDPGRTET